MVGSSVTMKLSNNFRYIAIKRLNFPIAIYVICFVCLLNVNRQFLSYFYTCEYALPMHKHLTFEQECTYAYYYNILKNSLHETASTST